MNDSTTVVFPEAPAVELIYEGLLIVEKIDEKHGKTLEYLRARDKKLILRLLFLPLASALIVVFVFLGLQTFL